MNSPLEHNFVEFKFSPEDKPRKDSTTNVLNEFDGQIDQQSSIDNLPRCEICTQQFLTKKDLRSHIITHLGQPRIILKRIPNLKPIKKKQNNTYWLDPEKRGSLKLTLKKQCSTDSIKLTLKKSSESEDFAVVNSNLNSSADNYYREDVAGAKRSDENVCKETEKEINEPFENVTINQQEACRNINFDTDEHNDPLEDTEKPLMDGNEGDSGVGSDTVNTFEKEDQNINDLSTADTFNNAEETSPDNEDREESDALEATCRETIENLKKLGEQSRPASPVSNDSPKEDQENGEDSSNMVQQLEENPTSNSESSVFPVQSPNLVPPSVIVQQPEEPSDANSNFNWNQLSTNLTNENNEKSAKENEQQMDNIDNAGSLLQNFLIEHQRRNQTETTLSNNIPPGETEYVSLEKLAETVGTCRVCNEKFKDIAHLDEHKSKAGHYQCNIPDCIHLIFNSPLEVAMHKTQIHGAPLSPNLNTNSPHLNQNSPHFNQNSPHLNTNSPHAISMDSSHVLNASQLNRNSPLTSPHQTNSPTYGAIPNAKQQMIPPVNFEQLTAPVQQLAQQVQRMPLPQSQLPPSLPPGANTMIHGSNFFPQSHGRPQMYRVSATPQGMHYPSHLAHLYSQYGAAPYPQMPAPPPLHPQIPQQMHRGRYPTIMQNARAPRMPQTGTTPRQRIKRPVQQQNNPATKQRRMDVLLPDRNEDADCHVIAQQKRNDGLPVIQNVQGAINQQTNKSDSTIHLTDSITLSVRQPGSAPAQVQNTSGPGGKKPDAKAVANVLAARGITVTPAANKNKSSDQNKQLPQQQRTPPPQPVNVTALNLNSAISIIPAGSQRKQQEQQGQFAVPQNRQSKQSLSDVERPPRPPTVDLTQDGPPPPPVIRRGRPSRALLTCQVCDKNFQNQEMLSQHMASHRATSKLLYKCNLCIAQYPTVQDLTTHKQTFHKEVDTMTQNGGAELALPVVDLKSPLVLNQLSRLGIQSYIPLSQLSVQTGGYFGLPIVTIDGARNPNSCNLGALGATSILSLGPLKHLSNR